ncbi:polyketide synthase [Kordia algicida OT-1]|uniref:Enoyl-CoA hydratase n=1 Tax=Kordia algicida OT-1 TaxID=391587 RepID=A9EAD1_9FLAO|nr:polyketide synthase [Kordia algicida]EDP94615.1 enoyl-CoA hydratase [Kordia algicida OT-1]
MENVVELTEIDDAIIQIKMQDKKSKNTFSQALTDGLIKAYKYIEKQEKYKAVILTGYDTYFASGGTQNQLMSLSDGSGSKFTDFDLYSLSLNCPIPVIAAMQGHGIGGGFAMGLFADFVILSKESIYTTNFMKYGFTPGMGATYILPKKIGITLAEEMLLTARNYRGDELKTRGIPFSVLRREEVMHHAYELGKSLAEKPRVSLVALKDHLVAEMRNELPKVIQQEVKMHEITFAQPEVKERIKTLFGQ